MEAAERVDKGLYKDVETERERNAREKKQKQARDRAEKDAKKKAAKTGESVEDILRRQEAGRKAAATKSRRVFYRLTCKDNGSGMPCDDIPNMLGRVLSSTKYNSVMQTRGKFGLGAKMVLIWSQMRVAQPMEVRSSIAGQNFISFHRFNIDLHKNAPVVREHKKLQNPDNWTGTEISVTIEGNFGSYKQKLLKYLKLIAIITPYASFDFRYVAEDEKNSFFHSYTRRTDRMPDPPREAKHHPSDVDLELLKKKIAGSSHKKLSKFLSGEFSNITASLAGRLVTELGGADGARAKGKGNIDISPKQMTDTQLLRLHQFMQQVRFADPDGKDLSAAGEYNLRLGVMKELNPDMVATHEGSAVALEGHAFIVEAAVSIGGKDPAIEQNQLNVFRFANRIPLLFEQGNDVITKTANAMKWSRYKIGLEQGVGVFVSIVSTKIPFKGTSKEYIGDNDKISGAVKKALEQCASQLRTKLAKREEAKQQGEKRKNLELYIPDVSRAVYGVLNSLKDHDSARSRCVRDAHVGILDRVKRGKLLASHFAGELEKYVDKKYQEDGLQYQMQNKKKNRVEDVFLGPLSSERGLTPALSNGVCTIQFLAR